MRLHTEEEFQFVLKASLIVRTVIAAGGIDKDCIIELHKHIEVLMERIMRLDMIAPRRIRLEDGKELIYRCPDDSVPVIMEVGALAARSPEESPSNRPRRAQD